jgi:hypothetical protein
MLKALIEFLTRRRSVISIFDESFEIRAPEGLESIAQDNTPADRLANPGIAFMPLWTARIGADFVVYLEIS